MDKTKKSNGKCIKIKNFNTFPLFYGKPIFGKCRTFKCSNIIPKGIGIIYCKKCRRN